jgi:hypothetical protein
MSHSPEQEQLILEIIAKIAANNRMSVSRARKLLLVKRNNAIISQFWQILDECLRGHTFDHMGPCPDCGTLELVSAPMLYP